MTRFLAPRMLVMLLFVLTLSASAQTADTAALERAFVVAQKQRNTTDYTLQPVGSLINGADGVVIAQAVDAATREPLLTRLDTVLAQRSGDQWHFYFAGDADYGAVYDSFSEDFHMQIHTLYDEFSRTDARPPQNHTISYYQLPWTHNTGATVTRSYDSHGTGEIDFDVDQAPITAAADGVIVYANDSNTQNTWATGEWWLWNVVVIQHADAAYVTYAHLAHNSIPQWIKTRCTSDYNTQNCNVPVKAGQVIGDEGNTGMSTAPHLHLGFGSRLLVDSRYPTAYAWNLYNVGFQAFGTLYDAGMVAQWSYGTRLTADNFYAATTWDFRDPAQMWLIVADTLRDDGVDAAYRGRQYTVQHPFSQLLSYWLNIDAAQYRYLYLRMSTQTADCAKLLFRRYGDNGFSPERRFEIPLQVDTRTHAYVVDVGQHPLWTGEVTRLRFDPACAMGGANTLRVDALQLLTDTDVTAMLDSNADGVLTPRDAVYVVNRVGTDDKRADVNGDGRVDNADVTLVSQYLGE